MKQILILPLALLAGFAGAALWDISGLGGNATREYLLANPEVLPEAMQRLKIREQQAMIDPLRQQLETPFPGAVMGNPDGAITLVEFTDYSCGYCRQSVNDVNALIAANPDLRVVIREFPILRAESVDAARMAMAAAQQGKYAAFHTNMFEMGQPNAQTIEAAATAAGMDLDLARAAIEEGSFDQHLQANVELAQRLGLSGTPGWVVGNQTLNGALGPKIIGQAIKEARES